MVGSFLLPFDCAQGDIVVGWWLNIGSSDNFILFLTFNDWRRSDFSRILNRIGFSFRSYYCIRSTDYSIFLIEKKQTKRYQNQNDVVATSDVQPKTNNNVTLSAVEGQQKRTNHQGVPIINQSPKSNQIIRDKAIEYQVSSDVALKELPKIMEPKEIVIRKEVKAKSDESLLADLDHKVKESTNKTSTVKVDAKSLLSQVDGEVEYSFREKMLQKINKNYQEVKVALANRNNE